MRRAIALALAAALFIPFAVFASETNGTISATNRYAWSENLGWFDFGSSYGNVHVQDIGLSGYAWSETAGWISLSCGNDNSCDSVSYAVLNDAEGNLTGEAWAENIGWILFDSDYGQVTIDADGIFHGAAWAPIAGWIIFNCDFTDSCAETSYYIETDWRPESSRGSGDEDTGNDEGSSGGGGGIDIEEEDDDEPITENEENPDPDNNDAVTDDQTDTVDQNDETEQTENTVLQIPEFVGPVLETNRPVSVDTRPVTTQEGSNDGNAETPEPLSQTLTTETNNRALSFDSDTQLIGSFAISEQGAPLEEYDEILYGALAGSGAASTPFFYPLLRTYQQRRKKPQKQKKSRPKYRHLPLLLAVGLAVCSLLMINQDYNIPEDVHVVKQSNNVPITTLLYSNNLAVQDPIIEHKLIAYETNDSLHYAKTFTISHTRFNNLTQELYIPFTLPSGPYHLVTTLRSGDKILDMSIQTIAIIPPLDKKIFLFNITSILIIFFLLQQYARSFQLGISSPFISKRKKA